MLMANKKVSLLRKCKTPDGWRRYPVVMSANGKVKPDAVFVGGVEFIYPTGHYELRSLVGQKSVWTRVEGNASEALAALKLAQKRATATIIAGDAGIQIVVDSKRVVLRDAAKLFVGAAKDRNSLEAAEIYERTLDNFFDTCTKMYADELTRDDVTSFHVKMRKNGLADRTVKNRHMNLRSFLLYLKLDTKEIAGKPPRYEKTVPEIFDPSDLTPFFTSLSTDYDKLLFHLLLTTGIREREAVHLQWVDISFARSVLLVRSKPLYRHKVKDSEQRELPLNAILVAQLKAWQVLQPAGFRLVFGKTGGAKDKPDGHLLRRLKGLVRHAGLNCGICDSCSPDRVGNRYRIGPNGKRIVTGTYKMQPECERWFLHKFRATYITKLLRDGMDLRTVMRLSGHSDMESVMRYLRPAEGVEVQNRVNAIDWGTGF